MYTKALVLWDQENNKTFRQDRRFLARGSNAGSLSIKDDNNHDINYECDYRHTR
jgi:hypothetical protein